MPGKFHRFVDPTYYLFAGETFPGGAPGSIGGHAYDRVNVTSGGVGGAGSANADAQKGAGPNNGTYFVAFGEDGTSQNANRGFRAVFESLDLVDDVLRTSTPKLATQAAASPGANNVVITGDVFVGDDVTTPAGQLVFLTDSNGRVLYNGTSPVTITDIDDGTPGSSVIGSGWYTNPTVRFSAAVSVAYRLNYGARTSVARTVEQEREANWRFFVLSASSGVRGETIGIHGIDEVYRRAPDITSASPTVNSPGAGATFRRDGKGLTAVMPSNTNWTTTRAADPFLAAYRAEYDNYLSTSAEDDTRGGDVPFVHLTSMRYNQVSPTERTSPGRAAATMGTFIPRDITAATLAGQPVRTFITKGQAATLNPGGASASRIQVAAPNYFHLAGTTSLRIGYDLILVTFGDGTQQAYVAQVLGPTNTTLNVVTLSGDTPSWVADTPCTIQWLSLFVSVGGTDSGNVAWGPLTIANPAQLTGVNQSNTSGIRLGGAQPANVSVDTMLSTGYFSDTLGGQFTIRGYITSDGSFKSYFGPTDGQGFVHHTFAHRAYVGVFSGVNFSTECDPVNTSRGSNGRGMSLFHMGCIAAPAAPITCTITATAANFPDGMWCEWIIENPTGCDVTMAWPAFFRFSDVADAQPGALNSTAGAAYRWRGVCVGGTMWMERLADYQP